MKVTFNCDKNHSRVKILITMTFQSKIFRIVKVKYTDNT